MRTVVVGLVGVLLVAGGSAASCADLVGSSGLPARSPLAQKASMQDAKEPAVETPEMRFATLWGLDLLISNDGFGMGGFYRRKITPDLSGFISLSVSGSKDGREVERYDPFTGTTFTPGKLNRFIVVPLFIGAQYRLFREDIVDTFRPYVSGGIGPTMVYAAPFVNLTETPEGALYPEEIEFFNSLSKGKAYFTPGGYIGAGAFFDSDESSVFGVNIRYYFIYLLNDGIPSLYDTRTGEVTATKKDFGGFFITLNIGMGG